MRKLLALCIIFLNFFFSLYAEDFPEKLSDKTSVFIVTVNFSDLSHSLFSKSCLRIYDKENRFDELIDFAYFHNFDDDFFELKFFLNPKRAFIKAEPYLQFFKKYSQKPNTTLLESKLNLTPKETAYLYNFINTMHKALPDYSYEFDIETNNSETHISQILHDCYRMAGDKSNSEHYAFSQMVKHKLSYKKINDSYILLPDKESIEVSENDYPSIPDDTRKNVLITLIILSSIFFILTAYQVVVYFYERFYIYSIFKTAQFFDSLILFMSGLSGLVIVLQNIFSNQTMFQNDFQYLYLFPLNLIAAIMIFHPVTYRRLSLCYWGATSFFCLLYIAVLFIDQKRPSLSSFLFVLPVFFRVLYYFFISLNIKKGHEV